MATFNEDVDCPQCRFPRAQLFDACHTVTIICALCGYSWETTPEREPDGSFRVGADDKYVYEVAEHRGHGAYHVRKTAGGGQSTTLDGPLLPETIEAFREALADPAVDATRSYLTSWDEALGRAVLVAGDWHAFPHPHPDLELRPSGPGAATCCRCGVSFRQPAGERPFEKGYDGHACPACAACAEGDIRVMRILPPEEGAAAVAPHLPATAPYDDSPGSHFLCSGVTAAALRAAIRADHPSAYIETDDPASFYDIRRALLASPDLGGDPDALLRRLAPGFPFTASARVEELPPPPPPAPSDDGDELPF